MDTHLLNGDAMPHGDAMTLAEIVNLRENITEPLTRVAQCLTTGQYQRLVHEAQ
jgi:hypothetical protein